MARINRFEDLHSWQKARQLANAIYDLTEHRGVRFSNGGKASDQWSDWLLAATQSTAKDELSNYETIQLSN